DRIGDVLHDRGLTGLRRRHDQGALPLTDRHDQVDDPGGQLVRRRFQAQPLIGVQRGELVEIGPPFRRIHLGAVDRVQAHQRIELLPLVGLFTLARGPHCTGDRVTAAQAVLADEVHRDVDVVRPGQVAGGAHERVVVQDIEDARDRLQNVVVPDLGLAGLAAALAVAATATLAEPATPATAAAFFVVATAVTVAAPVTTGATLIALVLLTALVPVPSAFALVGVLAVLFGLGLAAVGLGVV